MKFRVFVVSFFVLVSFNSLAEKSPEELSSTCLGFVMVLLVIIIFTRLTKCQKLETKHKDYIVSALKAYRSGERSHPTMKAHAADLSDSDIDKIASYFSSFKSKVINNSENVEMIDKANSCVGCHGVDGNSEVPNFPRIAGQYEDYLYQALKSYKNGGRNNAIMTGIASTLSEDQMKSFLNILHLKRGMLNIDQGRVALKKQVNHSISSLLTNVFKLIA